MGGAELTGGDDRTADLAWHRRIGADAPRARSPRYILRRTREGFRAAAPEQAGAQEALWKLAKEELEVARRQSIVYGLYQRQVKNVLVRGLGALCVWGGTHGRMGRMGVVARRRAWAAFAPWAKA